jgi:small subunit ribosomal protein S19
MPRSIWKGPFVERSLSLQIQKALLAVDPKKKGIPQKVRSWSRSSVILPQTVGMQVSLYNGKKHLPLLLRGEMVGHKLGEFVATRQRAFHKIKVQRPKTK